MFRFLDGPDVVMGRNIDTKYNYLANVHTIDLLGKSLDILIIMAKKVNSLYSHKFTPHGPKYSKHCECHYFTLFRTRYQCLSRSLESMHYITMFDCLQVQPNRSPCLISQTLASLTRYWYWSSNHITVIHRHII